MSLLNAISKIDRFNAEWTRLERKKGQELKQLRWIATVSCVSSSTRLEGSKMTDAEVENLLKGIDINALEDRDSQEVTGYYDALDLVLENHSQMSFSENVIKMLHKQMMKYCTKDDWHAGDYKITSNAVERQFPDGNKQIIFRTTKPGIETEDAMRKLLIWYHNDTETHFLIKTALFVYEFLSIHPFQDGNGRLSRIITTLLLLQHKYVWIEYVSFEKEIENRKSEYYSCLMSTQQSRPNENVDVWLHFFIDCLSNLIEKLNQKMYDLTVLKGIHAKEQLIPSYLEMHPNTSSSKLGTDLGIQLPTIKKQLQSMYEKGLIGKTGMGKSTAYFSELNEIYKKDQMFSLDKTKAVKEFSIKHRIGFLRIVKCILKPEFDWNEPDDWFNVLAKNDLRLEVTVSTQDGFSWTETLNFVGQVSPFHYKPIFALKEPIEVVGNKANTSISPNISFPWRISIGMKWNGEVPGFSMQVVYESLI